MIFFDQIKERKLAQWGLAYLAGAWAVLQCLDLISDRFGWPDAWLRAFIIVLTVGFFAVLVVAWYHGERRAERMSRTELAILTVLLVLAGAAVAFIGGPREDDTAAPTEMARSLTAVETPAERASIAVLPFQDMSPEGDQAYFSDGLTEELLNVLAQIPGLRVAARTSAFAFKDEEVTADSIGRALRVAHLVEGSVRKAGERIRITAQLIDARSGFHQWSQTYDRDLADVFAVQDEISRAIAEELRVRVGGEPLVMRKTDDPEAYTLFLRATQAMWRGGNPAELLSEAERLFEAALARDSAYAGALAGLANVHRRQAYHGLLPEQEGYARAREEAKRALALDAEEPMAHFVLAVIADFYDRDYAAAAGHYRRALELNPSDADSHSLYGWLLMRLGQTEEALREGRRAVELDPLSGGAVGNLGALYAYAREYERAVEQFQAALALEPDDVITLANLVIVYSRMGRHAEAVEAAERALALGPEFDWAQTAAAYAYARAGRRDEAEQLLAALPGEEFYLRATVETGLGDADAAFALLERAVEVKDDAVADLGMDPVFDPLRDDPRMDRLLERLGLEAATSGAASR